jgi:hypothetical protein
MGEFVLEELDNRQQMESKRLDSYKRLPLDKIWFDAMQTGEIWTSLKFYGESSTTINPRGYSFEIRLFNTEKRLDLACSMIKKSITDPECFYIAFPIGITDGKHFTEVAGGVMEAGKEQIKGSACDWNTMQNFTAVRNAETQVVLGCAEMPLIQLGAINTGRYQAGATPESPQLFSWPMNNYWTTNFNAEQRGGHSWTYNLTSSSDVSNNTATRFGWGCRVPFLTRILPGAGSGDQHWEGSFVSGWPSNILLVSANLSSDRKSIMLHVRETDGKSAELNLFNGLTNKALHITEVDVTGNPVQNGSCRIGALESKFFKIEL